MDNAGPEIQFEAKLPCARKRIAAGGFPICDFYWPTGMAAFDERGESKEFRQQSATKPERQFAFLDGEKVRRL
jgi:hypothetical protein